MTSFARRVLENLLRDQTRRRHLPADFAHAAIIMSAAGGLGAILKPIDKFDPVLLEIARSVVRPGSIVWDVGANLGLFSVAAAAIAGKQGKIYSFEPDVSLVQLLRRSAGLQSAASAPITIVPCAIASAFAVRQFAISKRARASNALREYGHSQMGGVAELQTVVTMALDDFAGRLPIPDLIKIDVEGAEIEVLTGGAQLLRNVRPSIVCEVSESNAVQATTLLRNAGYVLFDGSKKLGPFAQIELATWSTLAFPEERLPAYLASSSG